MRSDDMSLVSVDHHVVEPPDMFDQHLPAQWKARAPHVVHRSGTDLWVFEGQPIPNIGLKLAGSCSRPTTTGTWTNGAGATPGA